MNFYLKKFLLNNFPGLKLPLRSVHWLSRSLSIKIIALINSSVFRVSRFSRALSVFSCNELEVFNLRPSRLVDPRPLPVAKGKLQSPQISHLNSPYHTSPQYVVAPRPGTRLRVASYEYKRSGGHTFAIGLESGELFNELSFDIFGSKMHKGLCDIACSNYEHYCEPCIVVLEPQAPTYGHWLLELLPRVLMISDYVKSSGRQPQDFHWFVSGSDREWEREGLEMLDLNPNKISFISGSFFASYDSALVPSFTSRGACNLCPELIWQLRSKLISACDIKSFDSSCEISAHRNQSLIHSKRIYLMRSGEPFRNVINEQDVIDALGHYNFVPINPRDLTFREKIRTFSSCSVLVGALSSGMSHSIFMNQGATVINILPLGYFPPAEARICRCVGVNQIMLPVLDSRDSSTRYGDIEIDLEALMACASELFS